MSMQTQIRIDTSETKGDLELRNNPAYETTTMVQPQSSINSLVELTVDVNPAYVVTKSQPIQQRQDESEPNYEVISTVLSRDKRQVNLNRGQPNECS